MKTSQKLIRNPSSLKWNQKMKNLNINARIVSAISPKKRLGNLKRKQIHIDFIVTEKVSLIRIDENFYYIKYITFSIFLLVFSSINNV